MNYNVVPETVSFSGSELLRIKSDIGKYPSEAAVLRERADKLMNVEPFTVTRKKLTPPSGNPHDYMTMGPYWWPDPEKADGLPYIRRDGIHNPDAKDRNTYKAMADTAYHLAHVAYIFERDDYAERAVAILRVWHLDEETYMTPHAEYAQAIPGICEGRGIGIIDFTASHNVVDACRILYAIGAMSDAEYLGMQDWYRKFADWLITSEKGIFEDNYFNNHGAWYDVQVLCAAIFTNRPELAKRVAMNSYRRRHKTHIMPDGSQPHELERTNAMSYSTMNLLALVKLASICTSMGYKEYTEKDEAAGSPLICRALEFLYPYTKDQSSFPYQQIKPSDFGVSISEMLIVLNSLTGDERYKKMAEDIFEPQYLTHVMPYVKVK